MRELLAAVAAAAVLLVLAVPAAAATDGRYSAEIRRTTGGVPHIKARDYGSLGFGYAYAYAQDQACRFADIMVTVDARRSRWFGPDASYGDLGGQTNNLSSDFFFQRIKDAQIVERLARARPPQGPDRHVRAVVRGFVAGWNAYLRRTGRDNLPDPRCRGAGWVRPIKPIDLYRRFYQLALRASGTALLGGLVAAAPPGGPVAAAARPEPAALARDLDAIGGMGSNGYAVGSDGARGARGLLLSNTHFPSGTDVRWYELHLTIPGRLNAIGAALQGVPVVNLGFNRHIAWTHTVSTARRFAAYELRLVPGRPTSYILDGRAVPMRERTVTVPVQGGETRSHTFYETVWGPVVVRPDATLTWTAQNAYVLADANAANLRLSNQWAAWNRATSVADWRRKAAKIQGNPWVNSIVADDRGNAYYGDDGIIPHADTAFLTRCAAPKNDLLLGAAGIAVLDGSRRAECRLPSDPDAAAPGIFGNRALPQTVRRDYTFNSNDSFWIPNPRQRLTGFPRIIGPEAVVLPRTRMAALMAEQRLAGTDGLGPPRFTLPTLQEMFFGNRNLSGELVRDPLVAACRTGPPDLSPACDVLAAWDLRADAGSRGAVLFREVWRHIRDAAGLAGPWAIPYSASDPLTTPSGLATDRVDVPAAVRAAVDDLRAKGIALDVPLGDLQYEVRGDERLPMSGCSEQEGCFNILTTSRDERGVYRPYTGSSFVMAAELGRSGPRGRAILRYSQSENPLSPHSADQTRLYAQERWLPMRFTERQIRSDPAYRRTRVTGRR
jgi:acyl-homoserine-lactone acylase